MFVVACNRSGIQTAQPDSDRTVRYVSPGSEFSDQDYVIGLVNRKLKEDGTGIVLELTRIPWDAWDQKTNLMFASGEEFDLIHVMQDLKTATTLYSMNAIQSLNKYIDNFPALKTRVQEHLGEFTVNGQLLAVPVKPTHAQGRDYGNIFYRQSIFKKVNGTIPTNVDELIVLGLKMQKAIYDELGVKTYAWTHNLNYQPTWLHQAYPEAPFVVENTLGIVKFNVDGTVESFYESDAFRRDCEVYKRLYDLGLTHPDILTLDNEFITNEGAYGRFVFGFTTFNYQDEVPLTRNTGDYLGDFNLKPVMGTIITSGIFNGNAVPASCKDPNIPLKFLDWVYTSSDNYRLFTLGEEGRDYKLVNNDRLELVNGQDGSPKYHFDEWQIVFADYVLFDVNATEKQIELARNPIQGTVWRMPTIGFNFESASVSNEMANLSNEIITSIYPIKFGLVDYASNIDGAIARLKAAGLEKVLDEYRRQFKAHYESGKAQFGMFER
ncbi:MAG: extracellular solute-binding protein [Prevotella sp.]|nr:extracellular solute-binding protein [Prevotella sp.]